MTEPQKLPKSDHDQLLKSFSEGLSYSVNKFDSNSVAISSGALVFTLSFIKHIVPLQYSIKNWTLYTAIVLFVVGVLVSYVGHLISINRFSKYVQYAASHEYNRIKHGKVMLWNFLTAVVIVSAMGFLSYYCIVNIDDL